MQLRVYWMNNNGKRLELDIVEAGANFLPQHEQNSTEA
jgi:hypothetical protein